MADPPGQGFTRLSEQIERRGTEEQIETAAPAGAARPIDEAAQDRKQPRCAVDFVEDDEPIQAVGQVQLGLGELGAILLGFEVQVERVPLFGQRQGQRGLARLARAEEDHRRDGCEPLFEDRQEAAGLHELQSWSFIP